MKRIHMRPVLSKNSDACYRSIENMINLSPFKTILLEYIPNVLSHNEYVIRNNTISLSKLQQMNSNIETNKIEICR